jgi:hypothetical protein
MASVGEKLVYRINRVGVCARAAWCDILFEALSAGQCQRQFSVFSFQFSSGDILLLLKTEN